MSASSDSPHPAGSATGPTSRLDAGKGRVLLLEDDLSLSEIIRDSLVESGYAVVAVGSGVEGVRQVMAHEFTMVLCDFNMPGLPGDMFYRAVEKIQPELCKAFVFKTGHRDDERTNAFIQSVNGFVLRKPFPLAYLLDAIAFAEVRRTIGSVFDGSPTPMEESRAPGSSPIAAPPSGGPPLAKESAAAEVAAPPSTPPLVEVIKTPQNAPIAPESLAAGIRRRGLSQRQWMTGIGLLVLCMLLLFMGTLRRANSDAMEGVAAASKEWRATQAEWDAISPDLKTALAVRSRIEMTERQVAKIWADRLNPRWTPALRSIVPQRGIEVTILDIAARVMTEDTGACEIRIQGIAYGPQPRLLAERYRRSVEEDLMSKANGRVVTTRLEQAEAASDAVGEGDRVNFVAIVSVGPVKTSAPTNKEAR